MPKKVSRKKASVKRVGDRVSDGVQEGRIIAVSDGIVAIEWTDGRVVQEMFERVFGPSPVKHRRP